MIRSSDPRQLDLDGTGHDVTGLAKYLAAAPLRPTTRQEPCGFGLFGDSAAQIDLVEAVHVGSRRET